MVINTSKTKTLIISTGATDSKENPGIKVEGRELESVDQIKFLGVTVDNQLRFNKHVEVLAEKGGRGLTS